MDKILIIEEPRKIRFDNYEERAVEPNEVLLRTLFSGISAGTEMTIYRGSNPYAKKRWDSELKLFLNAQHDPRMYPTPLGYEEVGRVVEVGPQVEGLAAGDLVYGSWATVPGSSCPAGWRCRTGCRRTRTRATGSSPASAPLP